MRFGAAARDFPNVSDAATDSDRLRQQDGVPAEPPAGQVRAPRGVGSTPTKPQPVRTNLSQKRQPSISSVVALYGLLAIVSLFLAGTTFLLVASPADLIRDRLVAQVQERTGRALEVRGGASLTLFPSLGVVMRDVQLSASSGMAALPILRAESMAAHVAWWPLAQGRIAVRALTLTRPVLDVAVDADGRHNWTFAGAAAFSIPPEQAAARFGHGEGLPPDLYQGLEKPASPDGRMRLRLARVLGTSLQEVRVRDGVVQYRDERSGMKHEFGGIDLHIGLGAEREARISGSWTQGGEKAVVEGETHPDEGQSIKLTLRLSGLPFEASWDGRVGLNSAAPDLDGQIAVRAASAAALWRWMGKASSDRNSPGPFAMSGLLKTSGSTVSLSDATITINQATAMGSLSLEPKPLRPLIKADLKISELDLDRYFASRTPVHGEVAPAPSTATSQPKPAESIGDLLGRTHNDGSRADGPRASNAARRANEPWSTEPIDLAPLRLVDLAGHFEIGRLTWREISVGPSRVSVTLDGGKLRAEVEDAQLYEGRGRGVLMVEQEGSAAVVDLTASIEQVVAGRLMQDAVGFDWVEGRGHLTLASKTRGASEREMAESLNGRAEFKVTEGAIVGWNVARVLRKLRQGQLAVLDRDPAAKTEFSELSGSFSIANGVASNRDLKLSGSGLGLTGEGAIVLAERTVDYTVRPKVALAAGGVEGAASALSIEVPVRIHGSWNQPKLAADFSGALSDPRTAETVQQIGRQLRSGDVEGAVKGILGDGPEAEKKGAKAKEFLKRFLKQ